MIVTNGRAQSVMAGLVLLRHLQGNLTGGGMGFVKFILVLGAIGIA